MPHNGDIYDKIAPRTKAGASVFSRRKSKKVTDLGELHAAELQFAKDYAAILKATGHSWRYISDTLNIQTGLVKGFAEEDDWNAKVAKVAADKVEGGLELLKSATVDLAEMLVDLARRCTDDSVKLRAIESGLDRVGLSKVNKSESKVTKSERHEHDLTDDFFSRLEALPIETQKQVAELMAEAESLIAESRGKE